MCVGDYAQAPYVFQKIGVQVFCMEELCYCLCENAYLLDHSIVSRELVEWIGQECGLTDLRETLYGLVGREASESDFVGAILDYVGFLSEEASARTKRTLSEGASLDIYEKRKVRADFYLKNGHVWQALQEYQQLEREIPYKEGTAGDRENLAKVHHNQGVLMTQLFLFKEAAAQFLRAYEIGGSEESYVEHLLAMRMLYPEGQYLSYVAEHEEAYRYSLLAEKRIRKAEESWQDSEAMRAVTELRAVRAEEGNMAYARETERLAGRLKEHYRSLMQG